MKKLETTKIGINRFTIFTRIMKDQVDGIISDIKKNESIPELEDSMIDDSEESMIVYKGEKIKIIIEIELYNKIESYGPNIMGATISSPSPLGLVIQTKNDINNIIAEYNKFVGSVSKSMPTFSECLVSEIEYSIKFDLNELGYEYVTNELWRLIRCGLSSPYYSSSKYNSLCQHGYPHTNLEINEKIICLCSADVIARHYRDNCNDSFVPISNYGKNSMNVMSFSVKVKTKDTIDPLMRKLVKNHSETEILKNGNLLVMKHLFSEKKIKAVIREYFEQTIMRGNYFPFVLAVEVVQNSDFNEQKKEDMVATLKFISENGDIHKTKQYLVKNQINGLNFNESLQNLASIGVNPITLPDELKIEMIPGILETCESLVYDAYLPVAKP